MSNSESHRVQFVADAGLVERTDAIAEIEDASRTEVIKRALRAYLEERREDDRFRRRAQEAFVDRRVDEESYRRALGPEELLAAIRLRETLANLGDGVPDPEDVPPVPTDEEFYGGAPGRANPGRGDDHLIVGDGETGDDVEDADEETSRAES